MNKLLVICGSTAVGKTSLGIHLAKLLGAEVVSADSRQVYRGMDIGTGKDLPSSSQFTMTNLLTGGYYLVDGIRLWGYDLVEPEQDFSVSHYMNYAENILNDVQQRNKLPIIVGGSGLYIKSIVDGIETATVKQNKQLRNILKGKKTRELFDKLAKIDATKAASLNASDRKNPRRLIRAIEIADSQVRGVYKKSKQKSKYDCLMFLLKKDASKLKEDIKKRVKKRINQGFEEEMRGLIISGINWDDKSMNTLGYKQWRNYFEGKRTKKEVIDEWIVKEQQYAKRQDTWFKKDKRFRVIDVSKENWLKTVENMAILWHNIGGD